jgi:FAD/FMN-containing dehydrogenase
MLDQLREIVGSSNVLLGADAAAYETDWRKRYTGKSLAVVRPANTEEVAAIVKLCAATSTAIVPQGGNTGLVGGCTPDSTGTQIILSMARMQGVREIDTANDTMTVEAGCVLQAVHEAAARSLRLFPLSLAAEGSCTIGGWWHTSAALWQCARVMFGA